MHRKHPKLARPILGYYTRTEYALVGTTCERIEGITRRWSEALAEACAVLTVTGKHEDLPDPTELRFGRKTFTSPVGDYGDHDDRLLADRYDLALVNGNHYPAARQIVFIDPAKAGTLERRRDQLTHVAAVVTPSSATPVPDWLAEHLHEQSAPPLSLPLERVDQLLAIIRDQLLRDRPPLRALVLAGGRSQRMGSDKAQLIYRDGVTEPQRLRNLCTELGLPVSLSLRAGEGASARSSYADFEVIEDRFLGLGPAGAICSALLTDPDAAWLVLACDLPLLDRATLDRLIAARRPDRYATAVRASGERWPEPLVAIYEPRAYRRLLQFLGMGYACPRKFLINSPVALVDLEDAAPVTNANTPEDRRRVLNQLGGAGVH